MQPVIRAGDIRAAERAWFDDHPGGDLMAEAAAAVAAQARDLLVGQPGVIVVIAGRGNNAGDGLYAAAELATCGYQVNLWLPFGSTHEAGLAAALGAGALVIGTWSVPGSLAGCELVIDALLGIGGRPELPAHIANVASLINDLALPVLAVDLPSGLDADSGLDHPCINAARTVTFGAPKLCHYAQPAASRCGEVRVVDLGVAIDGARPVAWAMRPADVAGWWPYPDASSDKYSRGVVGMDTGSQEYPGAAVLGVLGAVYSGAGMVRFAGHPSAFEAIHANTPSAVVGGGRVQTWVCGSGWGSDDPRASARLAARLAEGVPCVIDAAALSVLPPRLPPNCLLTPHSGELARLLGVRREQVTNDPIGHAKAAVAATGAAVLLKGATQWAVGPDGDVVIAVLGPAWTAQAGSGDVLAGVAGTLLAAGVPAHYSGAVAASIQALAAASACGPEPPDSVARRLPQVVGQLEGLATG